MAVCHYHRDRAGIGVCMRCRKVICADCCTRLDGVNHCHQCLAILGRSGGKGPTSVVPAVVGSLVLAGLGWLFLAVFFWSLQGKLAP